MTAAKETPRLTRQEGALLPRPAIAAGARLPPGGPSSSKPNRRVGLLLGGLLLCRVPRTDARAPTPTPQVGVVPLDAVGAGELPAPVAVPQTNRP